MKRGIFFALVFGAFFLMVVSLLVFYSQSLLEREAASMQNERMNKFAYITDDISSDLQSFLKINSFSMQRISPQINSITINETIPSGYANPSLELAQYQSFIENHYALKNNLQGKLFLDLNGFSAGPMIILTNSNMGYSYSDLGKTSAIFRGGASVQNFSLVANPKATDVFSNCGWESIMPGDFPIRLEFIGAQNCPIQSVTIDSIAQSRFWINTTGGKYLNITLGLVDSKFNSIKLEPNFAINSELTITYASDLGENAVLNAGVDFVDYYKIQGIILAQN